MPNKAIKLNRRVAFVLPVMNKTIEGDNNAKTQKAGNV